jgi:Rrf2 family nitric oxide-sensitive transcriptional repressor
VAVDDRASVKLTRHTDYSLRALIYLGVHTNRRIAIAEISEAYAISRNHLVKVIQSLAKLGVVKTIRGRSGGVILALPPEEIVLGRVIRGTEPCFRMVEPPKSESEVEDVSTTSGLATILGGALNSFFEQLDKFTLADLLGNVDLVRISADEPIVLPTPIPSSPQL